MYDVEVSKQYVGSFQNCVLKTILEHVGSETNIKAMDEFIPFLDKWFRTEFSMP